ncbi:hypothetical protein [Micromonospora sp. NBC_00617]|uniref:DUF7380 domain-containing protein n=1 Tax=Micromonospora sp. NBC_00617 TaxID=2903587 RepID=UPI0030E2E493
MEDQQQAALPPEQADAEPVYEPQPYAFEPSQMSFAVEAVDLAVSGSADSWAAAAAVANAPAPDELGDVTMLRRELCRALTYSLHLGLGDEEPGCGLNADGNGLLPAVKDLPEPVIQLWRAVADSVTEPAANARLHDLLWCRRDRGAGLHAACAARAYLQLANTGTVDMDAMEFLLRAWTLARQISDADVDHQARARLGQIVDDMITQYPGARPGILLPALAALSVGPVRAKKSPPKPDPIDVGDLLGRAAAACRRGSDATAIARYRRSRSHAPSLLQTIARDEVAAYFRDADDAPHPAVRMARLSAAARIAHERGLRDLERDAATQMQNIDPASLGMHTFTASSTVPAHRIEPLLHGFTRPARWQQAMDAFLDSDCPTGDVTQLRAEASANRSPLSRILRPVRFAGGLPRAVADTDQDLEKQEMSFYARVVAENHGRLLATGLNRLADRYGIPSEDDIVDYLLTRGARDPALARSLAKALRHFWNRDIESAIHLATPKVETAARALLIELDEGIYRAESAKTPGGFPGLYALLANLETVALDESWAFFFNWLLAGPWGANLRNDVSHGLPAPMTPAYAALILRAVSVLAIVAGPMTTIRQDASQRRDRDELIALLTSLTSDTDPTGRRLNRLAGFTERLAWRLRLAQARRIQRRKTTT